MSEQRQNSFFCRNARAGFEPTTAEIIRFVKRRVLYTNYTAIVCLLSFVHKRQETYDGRVVSI